jgi:hypothetical protein
MHHHSPIRSTGEISVTSIGDILSFSHHAKKKIANEKRIIVLYKVYFFITKYLKKYYFVINILLNFYLYCEYNFILIAFPVLYVQYK